MVFIFYFGHVSGLQEIFQKSVSRSSHLIVSSLFFECFTKPSQSHNKCVSLPTENYTHFTLAFCFNNKLCTRCVLREQVTAKK